MEVLKMIRTQNKTATTVKSSPYYYIEAHRTNKSYGL